MRSIWATINWIQNRIWYPFWDGNISEKKTSKKCCSHKLSSIQACPGTIRGTCENRWIRPVTTCLQTQYPYRNEKDTHNHLEPVTPNISPRQFSGPFMWEHVCFATVSQQWNMKPHQVADQTNPRNWNTESRKVVWCQTTKQLLTFWQKQSGPS